MADPALIATLCAGFPFKRLIEDIAIPEIDKMIHALASSPTTSPPSTAGAIRDFLTAISDTDGSLVPWLGLAPEKTVSLCADMSRLVKDLLDVPVMLAKSPMEPQDLKLHGGVETVMWEIV